MRFTSTDRSTIIELTSPDPEPMIGVRSGKRYPLPFSVLKAGEPAFKRPRPQYDTVRPEDPEPWRETSGPNTGARYSHNLWASLVYAPRPAYRDPANLILVQFRFDEIVYGARTALHDFLEGGGIERYARAAGAPDQMVEHAREVLTRLRTLRRAAR